MMPSPPQSAGQWVRVVGNYLNVTTPLGLLVAAVGRGKLRRGPRGLWLAEGYRFSFPRAGAFTIGDVLITASDWPSLLRRVPGLLRHEERHAWQYLVFLGLPFYPAYGLCLAWSWLRTGDRAARNAFERHAGLALGGYRDVPVRPLREALRALLRSRRAAGPAAH